MDCNKTGRNLKPAWTGKKNKEADAEENIILSENQCNKPKKRYMNALMARALLGNFSAYSPVLPPIINSIILELYLGARDPASPKVDPERDALERNFQVSLNMLHKYFENDTHHIAGDIVKKHFETREPFALYLRNFAFGAKQDEPENDESGFVVANTQVSMDDDDFQRWLIKDVIPLMPVVAVENPTIELRRNNSLPRLSLTNETWQQVITPIISGAGIIIILIGPISNGLRWELDTIRRAKRQSSCILFYKKPIHNIDISDFPTVLEWNETDPATAFGAISKVPVGKNAHYPDLDILPSPAPDLPFQNHYGDFTANAILASKDMFESGNFMDASDILTAAIATSFWSQHSYYRVIAYRYLAKALLLRNKVQYAVDSLELALSLFERIGKADPSFVARLVANIQEFNELFTQHGNIERIERLQARLKALQSLAATGDWEVQNE